MAVRCERVQRRTQQTDHACVVRVFVFMVTAVLMRVGVGVIVAVTVSTWRGRLRTHDWYSRWLR